MKTQLEYAKAGTVTPEMKVVASYENVNPDWLRQEVALGHIVIPKNVNHQFEARGVGAGLSIKVNANIGTSDRHCSLDEEMEKLQVAVKYGADAIMDLSTGGDLRHTLKAIIEQSPVMVGTVPIYSVATRLLAKGGKISELNPEDLFAEIAYQAQAGVDFMTLHCGITQTSVSFLQNHERTCGVVSRGGSILKRWMSDNNRENPLYEQYDRILEICRQYDVTISLGDGFRPGCGDDATDRGQIAELLVLGELVSRAHATGVQVMVEGPGHVPLNQIETNMKIMKRLCNNAPFYVLGPLPTDAAPGYDHIVGAIGGAIAGLHGANFLCYVTPAEHLCLPNVDDVREGVIASRIAAQCADSANNIGNARSRDLSVSKARRELSWEGMFANAINPEQARKRKQESESSDEDHCTMCGNLCAIKNDCPTV